jgi:hypothetical protein
MLTLAARTYLLHGLAVGFDADDVNTVRALWKQYRGELLPAWIKEHPGTRPHAWWEFERPKNELRRCLAGWLPIETSPIWMGFRHHWVDKRTVIEPQVFYLERLKLLTPAERRTVATLKEKAVIELEEGSRLRGCSDPSTWNWDGMTEDWNGKGAPNADT